LIEEYRCTPEEIIFLEGDLDESYIYFVEKGKVEIFINCSLDDSSVNPKRLYTLQKGSYFGETEFFTGSQRNYSIRSVDFTTLLMIKRKNFL
jgi:CRP-like cAMP-binding protein